MPKCKKCGTYVKKDMMKDRLCPKCQKTIKKTEATLGEFQQRWWKDEFLDILDGEDEE